VLITEDGWEPLTSFSLELRPDVARDTTA
jgi:hypothetical protein